MRNIDDLKILQKEKKNIRIELPYDIEKALIDYMERHGIRNKKRMIEIIVMDGINELLKLENKKNINPIYKATLDKNMKGV